MKTNTAPDIGAASHGGFIAGTIRINGQAHLLIVSPKAEGEHEDIAWNDSLRSVEGALSYDDGMSNTKAMADAGSTLAKWALDLNINGFTDWYIPSQDELELIYRNLKPTSEKNYCWARSGINLSAELPTRPYTPDFPVQTSAPEFQEGGSEALDDTWYWSSTQYAGDSDYAWYQGFNGGGQYSDHKDDELRARAVRRLVI